MPMLQENSTHFQMVLLEMSGSFHSSPRLAIPPFFIFLISVLLLITGAQEPGRGSLLFSQLALEAARWASAEGEAERALCSA